MSRAERRALVDRSDPALPVSQQCRLLAVSRSSVYGRPAEVGEEDRTIMALIDQALSGPTVLRLAPDGGMAGDPRSPGQPQAGPADNLISVARANKKSPG